MAKHSLRDIILDDYPVGSRVGYVWPGGGLFNSGFGVVVKLNTRSQFVLDNGLKFSHRGEEVSDVAANRVIVDPVSLDRRLELWNRDQRLRLVTVSLIRVLEDIVSQTGHQRCDHQGHDILVDAIRACELTILGVVGPGGDSPDRPQSEVK